METRDFIPARTRSEAAWEVWAVAAAFSVNSESDLNEVRVGCSEKPWDATGWARAAAIHLGLIAGGLTAKEASVLSALDRYALYRPEPGTVSSDP